MGKLEVKVGDFVKFAVGRSKSEYEAKVTGHDGQFLVTEDAERVVRKVRPGACSVVVPSSYF